MPPVVPIRDDFPDWGAAPSLLTFNPDPVTITGPAQPVATFLINNYQYGVLTMSRDSSAIFTKFAFNWMGTVGAEASIASSSPFVLGPDGVIVIPFQAFTPTLAIVDTDSTTYPYDAAVSLTLLSSPPYQHGFPGGIFAINDAQTIAAMGTLRFTPLGCGPGLHIFNVAAASIDYDVTLTIYPNPTSPIVVPLGAHVSGLLLDTVQQLPATQWYLDITNNSLDDDFVVTAFRTPNPQ